MPKRYTYQPLDGRFAPGLQPGDTIEARSELEAQRFDRDPLFTPIPTDEPDEPADGPQDTTKPARKRGKK